MAKVNCWEYKKCGREFMTAGTTQPGCPAALEGKLDQVHGGLRGGRACWVVAGTHCGGKLQGTFAKKYNQCEKCDFYELVKHEEGPHFQLSILLLKRLQAA